MIRAHVLAMYAPSLISGWLVARLGTDRMLWAGIPMELVCIVFAAMGQSVGHYQLALIALAAGSLLHNIGWVATNFVAVTMLLLLIPLLIRKRVVG